MGKWSPCQPGERAHLNTLENNGIQTVA